MLEGSIKTVLRACTVPEDELFHDPSKNLGCKVFAISETSSKIPILIGQQLRMHKIEKNLRNHHHKKLTRIGLLLPLLNYSYIAGVANV